MKRLELLFEWFLWDSRYIVLLAVISSLAVSIGVFFMSSVDAYYMLSHLGEYASPTLDAAQRSEIRSGAVTHVVEIVDGYLLATVMLIFSLGLYELFISKIDMAENDENSSKVLFIASLDDLKARLAKVIIMILIVKYFEHATAMAFDGALDLLYLAAGIALIGLAIFLTHAAEKHGDVDKTH